MLSRRFYCGDVRSRTSYNVNPLNCASCSNIAVTFDLGRVTTSSNCQVMSSQYCGDVRSRTSYNRAITTVMHRITIAVTFDLGRVTTHGLYSRKSGTCIAVTFDLGRVTTTVLAIQLVELLLR